MKIRKLTIKNIASIETAEIDFENGALGEAPLFLICGDTGSGKTTILDCITLALYGKTPRYNGAKVKNAQEIGGFAYNDTRQFVRHGATSASAWLSLIGNDGRPYEAEWSVEAISRGKNKGELKDHVWTWKDCSPNGLTWVKVEECKAAVQRAVGLEFEHFCRTTMLAQGQFTQFLLGTDVEKAAILEKLTDTSRYSELGKAISEKYTGLNSSVDALEWEIANIPGLGDKREQIENRIKELVGQIEMLGKEDQSVRAKLQWLKHKDELAENMKRVQAELVTAFAALKALDRDVAEGIEAAEAKLEELKEYLDANADKAAMYESAELILQNLADVREARRAKVDAEAKLAECGLLLPELNGKVEKAREELEKAKRALDDAQKTVADEEKNLTALDRDGVQKARNEEEKLRGSLLGLEGHINGLLKHEADIAARELDLSKQRDKRARLEAELPGLKSEMERALDAASRAKANRDAQKKLVDDGIEKLVSDLKVGDTCPVCGNKIEKLQAKGYFKSLFQELDAECTKSDGLYVEKEQRYTDAVKAVYALGETIAFSEKSINEEKAGVASEKAAAVESAKCIGLPDATLENIKAALGVCESRIVEFDAKLAEIDEQDRKLKSLRAEVDKLGKVKDAAIESKNVAEQKFSACENQMSFHRKSIEGAVRQANDKLAVVSGRVSISGWVEAWELNANAVETQFKAAVKEYSRRKGALPEAENKLAALEKDRRQITECIQRAVGRIASLATVERGEIAAESTAEVEGLLGRFTETKSAVEKHSAARPADLQESDTVENLEKRESELKMQADAYSEERGRCQQLIADDDVHAAERVDKREKADKLRTELGEWKAIYDWYGDADGNKIRREIQSYVLANVLLKANYYLKQLSERYELFCKGLTLSVADSFEGGAVRPVNTLSGGEQFLVSLALALGLAGMSDTGLGVDMLLIDEGFGTLSGEHLNLAIEALERLNALTGSRKVGVISHVERLRERIPTHVEVTRRGQEPSMVRVVARGETV